jgi:hypothetical protein
MAARVATTNNWNYWTREQQGGDIQNNPVYHRRRKRGNCHAGDEEISAGRARTVAVCRRSGVTSTSSDAEPRAS